MSFHCSITLFGKVCRNLALSFFAFSLPVFAQTAGTPAPAGLGSSLASFIPIILLFFVMWFLMIRPQMKRAKEHKTLLDGLKEGDEVTIQGGIAGKIVSMKEGDGYIKVEISQGVAVMVSKPAVSSVLPSGTVKN